MTSGHLTPKASTFSSTSPLSIKWWDNSITAICFQSLPVSVCLSLFLFLLPLIHCLNQVICTLVCSTFWMCVVSFTVSFSCPFPVSEPLRIYLIQIHIQIFFFFLVRTHCTWCFMSVSYHSTSIETQNLTTHHPPFLRPRWIGGFWWFKQF